MSDLCIYFGMELPEREWAAGLVDVDVVLEPYHPLVKYGGFAEFFPRARRYVYVNPTSVDPWELERSESKPPLSGYDARWGLPRLDLDQLEAREWAIATAVHAFGLDDGDSHGLFVDDLDRLIPERTEFAIEYLARVAAEAQREPRWFLNRGFALWARVEALDAVLLEDIAPHLAARAKVDEVRWLREVVLPAAGDARARGVRVHALSYSDQEGGDALPAPDTSLERDVAQVLDSLTVGAHRRLEKWRIKS